VRTCHFWAVFGIVVYSGIIKKWSKKREISHAKDGHWLLAKGQNFYKKLIYFLKPQAIELG